MYDFDTPSHNGAYKDHQEPRLGDIVLHKCLHSMMKEGGFIFEDAPDCPMQDLAHSTIESAMLSRCAFGTITSPV